MEEIYAAPEFEQMAELVLAPVQFDSLKSSARGSFDKMTFRQRLMVYAMELDLTTELFGHSMFAPIIVGPVSRQGDLHDEVNQRRLRIITFHRILHGVRINAL